MHDCCQGGEDRDLRVPDRRPNERGADPELRAEGHPVRTRETVLLREIYDDAELFGVISRFETLRLRLNSLRRLPAQVAPQCLNAPSLP